MAEQPGEKQKNRAGVTAKTGTMALLVYFKVRSIVIAVLRDERPFVLVEPKNLQFKQNRNRTVHIILDRNAISDFAWRQGDSWSAYYAFY